ncbi:carnitine operon protein CaiE [Suttonella ornithocola]|uniref:Carnitine operon protein CaiE n=1 Tax=Suttonella ornithocola TaxID=279832 RepID=A0A380MNP6_9GAMM|nr:gamma carbonic anhydrase family protein [Suttonella ornithocola]SUO93523.1 carnitine operon protein CaiE [Suttonella ornithocola]
MIHATHTHPEFTGEGFATTIGDDVIIGHNAVVHGCCIANEVLVGMNATVLDGVVVESQVLIAAGALVPPGKRLVSGWLYAGNPAKPLRELTDKEEAFFRYSASHYVSLADKHRQSTRMASIS